MDIIHSIGMKNMFSEIIETPQITTKQSVLYCLEELSPKLYQESKEFIEKSEEISALMIGIKSLVELIEICENIDEAQSGKAFLSYLERIANPLFNLDPNN